MEIKIFNIKGRAPLLMHSDRGVNPLDPLKRKIATFTSKRKKTDEDHEEIARLEFEMSMYHDKELGPYIPGHNISRMIRDAAAMTRRGKDVERALIVTTEKAKINYSGPRDIKGMWEKADDFADMRSVVIQRSRTMRCRPIFREWGLSFEIAYDTAIFDDETICSFVDTASSYIGLGDFRPRYGRFDVV